MNTQAEIETQETPWTSLKTDIKVQVFLHEKDENAPKGE